MSSLEALQLDGSMVAVGRVVDNSFEDVTLYLDVHTVARRDAHDISLSGPAPSYYVELSGNINYFVDVSLSGADNIDDAWALNAIYTNNGSANGAVTIDKDVSQITLAKSDGTSTQDFDLTFVTEDISGDHIVGRATVDKVTDTGSYTISSGQATDQYTYRLVAALGTDGLLSFTHSFDDDSQKSYSIDSSIFEESTLAQELYFNNMWSGVASTTSVAASSLGLTDVSNDQFSVTLDVNNALGTALTSELASVQGETLLTSLYFDVNAIDMSNTNTLSQWANSKGYNGNDDANLFEKDQEIWVHHGTGLTKNITLVMNDYNGDAQTMFTTSLGVKLVQGPSNARSA